MYNYSDDKLTELRNEIVRLQELFFKTNIENIDLRYDLARANEKIEQLREALKHMLRWYDQLSPTDIAKAEAALKEGE
jgi:hypothetical protein